MNNEVRSRTESIKYRLRELPTIGFSLLTWVLPTGVLRKEDLAGDVDRSPGAKPSEGVVLSGRGPNWLYPALAHRYHYCKWVAIYDPRQEGAIVVATHDPNVPVGTLIEVPHEINVTQESE